MTDEDMKEVEDSGMLLYKSKWTFGNYVLFALMFGTLLAFDFKKKDSLPFSSFIEVTVVSNLIFLIPLLLLSKSFDIYENRLVVRYPKILFIKPRVFNLQLVKKIVFKFGRRGQPDLMAIVYDGKRVNYWFWKQFGADLNKVVKTLRRQGVKVE